MRKIAIIITSVCIAIFSVPAITSAACTIGQSCQLGNGSTGVCRQNPEDGTTGCGVVTTQSGGNLSPTTPSGGNTGNPSVTLINPLKGGTTLETFLNSILTFVIRIGTIAIIVMLVFVGYKFVAAQGNPAKISEAQKMLLWTLVGALILLGAKAISIGIMATVQALSVGS